LLQEGGEINVGPVKAVKPMCGCGGEVPLDWCEIKKEIGWGLSGVGLSTHGLRRLEAGGRPYFWGVVSVKFARIRLC